MITDVRVYPVGMLLINKDSYSNTQAGQVDLVHPVVDRQGHHPQADFPERHLQQFVGVAVVRRPFP